MPDIKCPHCGAVFTVDESEYALLLQQVRNDAYTADLNSRITEAKNEAKKSYLNYHKAEMAETDKKHMEAMQQKDAEIAKLMSQVQQASTQQLLAVKEAENKADKALAEAMQQKDAQIAKLQSEVQQASTLRALAVKEAEDKINKELSDSRLALANMQTQLQAERTTAKDNIAMQQESHNKELRSKDEQLRSKDDEIARLRDFRLKQSTKMVGESLEQHCYIEYERQLRPLLHNARFEKDNDASEGTKGDFIFRAYDDDGTEYLSIMFEMKNEADGTQTKHKNEDFYKKLDEDRRKKSCEYAVLVSMLEQDNELFNYGIVDVSHRYERMYVIRPQFFVQIITLLNNTSRKSLEYRRELQIAKQQNIDVTNFEQKIEGFKHNFLSHLQHYNNNFDAAIKDIDATIKKMQAIKDSLTKCKTYLSYSKDDLDDLTIKKLTRGNPTMKQKFDEAANGKWEKGAAVDGEDTPTVEA